MGNIGYAYKGFTVARLKRFLTTGGQEFRFDEYERNQYGDITETVLSSKLIWGVLHKAAEYAIVTSRTNEAAGSKTRTNLLTSILTSWESLGPENYSGGKELKPGMTVFINGVQYRIIKTENLNNWDIVAEIFLEEYDEWKH